MLNISTVTHGIPKRGEMREDGLAYWGMRRGKQHWTHPETIAAQDARQRESAKVNYRANPEAFRDKFLKWRRDNPERNRASESLRHKRWWQKHKDRLRPLAREKAKRGHAGRMEYQKRWRAANKERERAKARAYYKAKWIKSPLAKYARIIRGRLRLALSKEIGMRRGCQMLEIIGCDCATFKRHISRQFSPGMTWENWTTNGWHLDHIIPLKSAASEAEIRHLCHYTNLRPAWWRDNISKGAKFSGAWQPPLAL